MGFKEILEKAGLGDLLNLFKIVVDNSKNIEIKDNVFIVDSKFGERFEYTLPNTVEYDDVREVINQIFKKRISGFVRRDLVLPEKGMLAARDKHKDIFRFYKDRVKSEHYHAMIATYTIMEFENKGDSKTANELFDKFVKRFPKYGRHIYNFCRSGLIEGKFWNELGFIIVQGATENVIREKFSSQFAAYVEFYPYAIWVAPLVTFKDVIIELRIKINKEEVIRLDIYLRGREKIDLLEDDLVELIDQKRGLSIEELSRYFIGNTPCVRIAIVKDPKIFKTF